MDTPSEPRVDATLPPPDPLAASDALRFDYAIGPTVARVRRLLIGAGVVCGVLFVLPRALGYPPQLGPTVLFSACLGATVVFWLFAVLRGWRRDAQAVVAIADGALHIPALSYWRGRRRIPLADLRRIVIAPVSGVATLFARIERGAPVVLALDGFAGAADGSDDARRFVDALEFRSRVRAVTTAVDFGPTRFCFVLLGVLIGLHILREAFGGADLATLLGWGGLVRTLVLEGDWYRLLLYGVLQPNPVALAMQVVALAVLLPGMQRALGLARTVLVLLTGVFVAGLGALGWVDGDIGYGAEAAVYALLGALAWLRISTPSLIAPTIWRLPTWLWVGFLCTDLLIALFTPGIGWPLRLMGLLAGLAAASVTEWVDARLRGASVWAALATLGLAGVASTMALVDRVMGSSEATAVRIVESPRASLADSNLGGWVLATSSTVDGLALGRARDALAARLANVPDAPAVARDTLATLHYRLGDHAAAIALEAAVQRQAPDAVFATQLARFARAAGGLAHPAGALVERVGERVCVQSVAGTPLDIDVTIDSAERLVGILQFERVAERACTQVPEPLGSDVRIAVGRTGESAQRVGTLRVSYWRADQRILALP